MLVAGDPVGARAELPGLVRETCAFAASRGLRVAALGASPNLVALYRQAGFRSLYLGDEAIVDTRSFSLEGRSIGKVRQSVSRAEAAGYRAALIDHDRLDDGTIEELERVSERWRNGAPERGFSMAMDSLRGTHQVGSSIVAATDGDGRIRAFIHFVPAYGRAAMSLSFMRRDRGTPNGLMEFVVVRAIQLLGERGMVEVSLNFAAFARWLSAPAGRLERGLGRAVSLANPFFQIESLLRFNAKFGPRWEPRYLVYERRCWLPRVGLAALRIEGQLPKALVLNRRWAGVFFAALGGGARTVGGLAPPLVALAPGRPPLGSSVGRLRRGACRSATGHGVCASHRPAGRSFAAATGALLLADAWFDVVTAGGARDRWPAVAFAVLGEIPLAILCFALARPERGG
jgi:lysyl-tRNA synthetase, class II